MPKRTITSAQNKAALTGFIDLVGEDKAGYAPVSLDTLASSLAYVAAVYGDKLKKQLREKDADSSGDGSDSIVASDVKILGSIYSVSISCKKYLSFIDEGVDGWAKPQGSRFKFKTKGVDPKSDMVKSVKKWLVREGKISSIKHKNTVSAREVKRNNITDTTTKAAITAAYMIKRQGIKPTHFWRDATKEMGDVIYKEFSAALKVDIVNNLTK